MYRCRVDSTGLNAKLAAWNANTQAATVQHVRSIVADVVNHADEIAPADTNKYRRAWIQAGQGCGVAARRLPQIQPSAYYKPLRRQLVAQATRMERRATALRNQLAQVQGEARVQSALRGYDKRSGKKVSRQRKDKRIAKLTAEIERLKQRAIKVRQSVALLDANPSATVIRRKVSYVLAGNERRDARKADLDSYAIEIEVRGKVYGGSGTLLAVPGRVAAMLHIKEPYAATIENKHMVKRRSIAYARQRASFGTSRKAFVLVVRHGMGYGGASIF